MGLFVSSSGFGFVAVLCSERERPFFVPSPAIRFAERGRGQGTETVAKLGGLPGLRRVTLLVPEACAMGLSSGRGPDVALLRRQPHGSLLTRRRRKADSNRWSQFEF
jgi:hypothetical protein